MAEWVRRCAGGRQGAVVVLAVEVCVMPMRVISTLGLSVSLLLYCCLKQLGSSLSSKPPMILVLKVRRLSD